MATSLEQASTALAAKSARANTNVYISPTLRHAAAQQTANSGGQALPGVNPQDWLDANRIHVKDGSLFIDPYLVLHPRELDPANEKALRAKLALTYSINNPSFFEAADRSAIALNLGSLIPVTAQAKRSALLDQIKQFNSQVETGQDAELNKELSDKRSPFAAIVRDITQHPGNDPVGLETLKNSLSLYMLVREKLTQNRFLGKLTEYVQRNNTPDQVIADLSNKIGVSPIAFREAALKDGIDGVGKLLGLDPAYVADVKKLTEHAAANDFGYNLVEHWHLGRQLQGLAAPLEEKITVGMDARITAKIDEYRTRVRHNYDVPEPVKKEEHRIAEMLNLLEPVQRAVMFKLGYEICFSPEVTADEIAFYKGIYGLNRKTANDLRDLRGTYRMYFSGRGDLEQSAETAVHEPAHVLFPELFAPGEINRIDQLINSDQARFAKFQQVMDTQFDAFSKSFEAYKAAGSEQQRSAITAHASQQFGIPVEGLFPYIHDAHQFQFLVKRANDTLSVEGARYNHSGYNSPKERCREVISRFAELKQVKLRGEPQLMQFLAPGLNDVWENHYLPHLAKVLQLMDKGIQTHAQMQKDAAPELEQQPKVEQRPTAPQPQQPVHADSFIEGASPLSSVSNITRLTPALTTLANMGVGVDVNR